MDVSNYTTTVNRPDGLRKASNLTQNQFLMWMGQQRSPEAPLYNMVFTFTIEGEIDAGIFQTAFQAVVDRSDALRTVIEEIDGAPRQRVLEQLPYQVEILDLSAEPQAERSYVQWLEQRKVMRLDLSRCLFDTALLKLADRRFIWYFNQHHIMSDAWSAGLIYQHMAEFYGLARQRRLVKAPALPDYHTYLEKERDFRASAEYPQIRKYWQEKIATAYEATEFFGKSVTGNSARTQRVSYELSDKQSQRLKQLALQKDVYLINQDLTLYSVFATVFFTFLHRLSGQDRLRLGAPFHNRPSARFKQTIGLFIEVGLLQAELEADDTFNSLLKKVQQDIFSSMRYAQPGISSSDVNRAYDVLLNYVHAVYPEFDGLPMRSEWVHSGYGDRYHSLRLQVHDLDRSGTFKLHFDFNVEVFGEAERAQTIRYFLRTLDALLADMSQPVSQFRLLSAAEWQQLVVDFNQTAAPVPTEKTVVQLFEEQAALQPEAIALRYENQTRTYSQVNKEANQLAHYLRAQGVGPDTLVPICMNRSPDVLVAILGTLKAGGAYVPVDPAYPEERIAYILEDIGRGRAGRRAVLLTHQQVLPIQMPEQPVRIIRLDHEWEVISTYDMDNPADWAKSSRLAYVIYTSGSTGQPKGVMIEHRSLMNYVWWAKNQYLGGKILDFPFFSSLSFDLTVTSIFVPLISGGKIVIYGDDDEAPGMEIVRVIEEDAVDIVKLTPAHLTLVKETSQVGTRIKKMIVGGEDFKTKLARNICEAFGGDIEIYNEYGPTEATVGCMLHRFDPDTDLDLSVPIGAPVANSRVYVLDRHLNPVPPGTIGEMFISGAGVARGYLNQEELTRERFLADPFEAGLTLYKTGDIARWSHKGQLEFLGRADHQVKIGGARIELGEVEATLMGHPDISACVAEVIQTRRLDQPADVRSCIRCGLPANYPGAGLDAAGVCGMCRLYERHKEKIDQYFKTMADLKEIVEAAQVSKTNKYDCLMLYSGGKDSTYALARLVEMGLTPLVFSFDNGFISEEAKANIQQIVEQLGLDLYMATTPAMPEIFTDSIKRYSNVCQGCFKSIYTLSMNVAHQHGIKYIFTGLSRGQLFETRLGHLFNNRTFEVEDMDRAILDARKVYHRLDDAVSRLLDVEIFKDDTIFAEIQFVDFYRYTHVTLDEIYSYLTKQLNWRKPTDTGRSTNCLINDLGIYIHQQERGFHNYALPYSWDVRLGHKTREAAMAELDDELDQSLVRRMMGEIGYQPSEGGLDQPEKRLAVYYVSKASPTATELRTYVMERLPNYMVPTYFIQLEELPLTPNGKVDRRGLPHPGESRPELAPEFVAPTNLIEVKLAEIWAQILDVKQVGIRDNFFDLGGASVPAVQVMAQITQVFQVELPLRTIFEAPTIAELGEHVEDAIMADIEDLSDEEAERLLATLG